jgi:hypothetical protein
VHSAAPAGDARAAQEQPRAAAHTKKRHIFKKFTCPKSNENFFKIFFLRTRNKRNKKTQRAVQMTDPRGRPPTPVKKLFKNFFGTKTAKKKNFLRIFLRIFLNQKKNKTRTQGTAAPPGRTCARSAPRAARPQHGHSHRPSTKRRRAPCAHGARPPAPRKVTRPKIIRDTPR